MPVLNTRWKLSILFALAAFMAVIAVVGWANHREGIKLKNNYNAYGVDLSSGQTNWTSSLVVALLLTVDSFDPSKSDNVLGFHIDSVPLNDLLNAEPTDLIVPSVPLRFVLMSSTVNFPANISMASQTQTLILDGDINDYPFDTYIASYSIVAFSSPSNSSFGDPLPITAFVVGTVQGFTVDTGFQGYRDDGSAVTLTFLVRRSAVTKLFAVIIFFVMWCLSGGIFLAAMAVWFRGKKVELPLIAISAALLFALPNVRNSQPGIPAVAGTTSDMTGFFWNILLVAISAFSLIINHIVSNRRGPPAKSVDPAPVPESSGIDLERGGQQNNMSPEKRIGNTTMVPSS